MKALILILVLVLVKVSSAVACPGYDAPEIQGLIAAKDEIEVFMSDDVEFAKVKTTIPVKVQKEMKAASMVPMNFYDPKHLLDYKVLGDVAVETLDSKGKPDILDGNALKIGKSCIVTSAHLLYRSPYQKMSEGNKGPYDKKIKFSRGLGQDTETFDASVFFQMTKPGLDYTIRDGKRFFYGHHDLVVLKLNNHSDKYFKNINVVSPEQVRNNSNIDLGRKMSCHGSPYYKTSKTYGNQKGINFKWKEENARAFEDDTSERKGGLASNLAAAHGMSGAPCYLNEKQNEVFALVTNGFGGSVENPTLPNVEFSGDYVGGHATYLALFHVLDQRMRSEPGYGLDQISDKCQ